MLADEQAAVADFARAHGLGDPSGLAPDDDGCRWLAGKQLERVQAVARTRSVRSLRVDSPTRRAREELAALATRRGYVVFQCSGLALELAGW